MNPKQDKFFLKKSRHFIVKLQNNKDKKKILKAERKQEVPFIFKGEQ